MTYGSVLDVLNAVDSERRAIWHRYPDWSEEQRQLVYEQRKAQIASSFGLSPTEPRGLQRERDRTWALDQDVDQARTVGLLLVSIWLPLTCVGGWTTGLERPGLAENRHGTGRHDSQQHGHDFSWLLLGSDIDGPPTDRHQAALRLDRHGSLGLLHLRRSDSASERRLDGTTTTPSHQRHCSSPR